MAQMANFAGRPGSWMRWYCLRVRVVVGTKTVSGSALSAASRVAAFSVMYESGLCSWISTQSSRGARGSGMVRSRAAAE